MRNFLIVLVVVVLGPLPVKNRTNRTRDQVRQYDRRLADTPYADPPTRSPTLPPSDEQFHPD